MKKTVLLLICAAAIALTTSCGNNITAITASKNTIEKNLSAPSAFTEIRLGGSTELIFTQSNDGSTSVTVTAAENMMEHITVSTSGGVLRVQLKDNLNIRGNSKIQVVASTPLIEKISTAGSSTVYLKDRIAGKRLDIKQAGSGRVNAENLVVEEISFTISGSARINIEDMDSREISTSISGSGNIIAAGKTENASIRISGSGKMDAENLVAKNVKASISGSGSVTCNATGGVDANVSGSGRIRNVASQF